MHTHIHIVCVCVCVNVIVFVGGVSKSRRVSWDKIVARVVYEKKRVRMCGFAKNMISRHCDVTARAVASERGRE